MTLNITGSTYNNIFPSVTSKEVRTKDGQKVQQPVAAVKVSDVKPEPNGIKALTASISIGGAVLLGIIGCSLLPKGASGGIYKRLKKYTANLNRRTYDLKADYKNLTLQQKIRLKFAQGIKPVAEWIEATSNLNVFKDGFTLAVMKKFNMMPLFNGINKVFKNIVLKTKTNSYHSAEMANLRLCNYLERLAKDPKAAHLQKDGEAISETFSRSFSTQHHYRRAEEMWERLADLHERVWNSFNIFKKENNIFSKANRHRLKDSYITMSMCEKERKAVEDVIRANKRLLSNNITDNYNALKNSLDNLKIHVDPSDKTTVELMQKLSDKVEKYNKLGGKNEALERSVLSDELKELLSSLGKRAKGSDKKALEKQISEFQNILDPAKSKKGKVQEALTRVKSIYGKDSKEYKEAKKLADEFNKKMNHALSTEMTAYEKLAELQMGSAPTDIFGILFPAALGVGLVIKAKDKDQRIKNTLTQGIPIIGGIGTAYYGTTRMLTGPTNMALGLISGALLSVIGAKVDDLIKNYRIKQAQFKKDYEALKAAQQQLKEETKAQVNTVKEVEKLKTSKDIQA